MKTHIMELSALNGLDVLYVYHWRAEMAVYVIGASDLKDSDISQ